MKKLFLLTTLLTNSWFIQAQQVLTYEFLGNFNEKNNSGPELIPICSGQFTTDELTDYGQIREVYHFDKNCGFYFDDSLTNFLAEGSYTIELYFKMKELNSWKRVIDFKSRTSDGGCYVFNGELNFYPIAVSSSDAPFAPEKYSHYVITREAATKQVLMYGDGNKFITFTDNGGAAVYDANKKLNFFHDDLVVPNEASEGSIAILKIYNYALDSTIVKETYENLGNSLSAKKMNYLQDIRLYPNPVKNVLHLELLPHANEYQYAIYDLSGRQLMNGTVHDNRIATASLHQGIYQLKVWNNRGETGTMKLLKQ